jgi:hypothetical protein
MFKRKSAQTKKKISDFRACSDSQFSQRPESLCGFVKRFERANFSTDFSTSLVFNS